MSSLNPRQFASLDYADADLYSGIVAKPPTATPLQIPINRLSIPEQQGRLSPGELAHYREEEFRRQLTSQEERNAQQARELARREREIARNLELQKSRTPPLEEAVVSSKDYEKKFPLPASNAPQQPPTSTGSPPPTPKGTAARASSLIEPTQTPAPAGIREAVSSTVSNAASALPRALPQSAGRLVIPGISAGITFASRVVSGQSVTQAAAGAVGTGIGSAVGATAGLAVAGPIGGIVGAAIGGFAGGFISDAFFPIQLPAPANIPAPPPGMSAFTGGQVNGQFYRVVAINPKPAGDPDTRTFLNVRGVISGFREVETSPGTYNTKLVANNGDTLYDLGNSQTRWTKLDITRMDGQPDVMPSPVIPAPPPDNRPGYFNESRLNPSNVVPTGAPQQGQPKYNGRRDVAPTLPGNNLPNSNSPYFPGHGGLAPSFLPNPTQLPSNLGGMMPALSPQVQPLPFAESEDMAIPRTFNVGGVRDSVPVVTGGNFPFATFPESPKFPDPGVRYDSQGNVLPTAIDGGEPNSFKPTPLDINPIRATGFTTSNPQTSKAQPVPDAQSPTPKGDTAPKPEAPADTAARRQVETSESIQKKIQDDIARLGGMAAAIAALTPAIQGIPDAIAKSPTVQASNKTTIQGAVCEIAQPTGCLGAPIKQVEDAAKANENKLNDILTGLNTAGSAAQLALLDIINNKLGNQLPGGIGGKLSRFADWMHLDRVLNILILASTLHNALMLSNDIGQTLVGAINNLLTLIGLKKEDGSAFDIGSVISGSIENLIKSAIGEDNYTELKEAWAKANRIYQATINIFNSLQGLSSTILTGLEMTAGKVAKIGNALRSSGEVLEKAYGWMNPQPKFNRVTQSLESLQNGASTIQMVTQAPIDVISAITETTNATTEFVKAIKEDDKTENKGKEAPEPDVLKLQKETAKTASAGLDLAEADLDPDEALAA